MKPQVKSPVALRTRTLWAVVALAVSAQGCFLFERPNPRLTKAVRSTADREETLTLSYDDANLLKKVVLDEELAKRTIALAWEGGVVESAVIESNPTNEAFPTDESVLRFTWDDQGRVSDAKETFEDNTPDDDREAPVTTSKLEYDDGGRFLKLEQTKAANGASVRDVTDFLYDDGGNIESVDSTLRVFVAADETSRAVTERDFELKDGKPDAVTIKNAGNVTVLDIALDDEGRVDSFEVATTLEDDPGNERRAVVGFSYDDEDRLIALTVSDDDGLTDDPLTELFYDDGDAEGMDVTPYSIFMYGIWDLKGQSHLTLDPKTQSARFVLPIW